MKKILLLALMLSACTSVYAASFDVNIKYGSKGDAVIEMQEFLISENYMSGQATGNFFNITLKAVKAFQLKSGLTPSGFWGPLTRQKATEIIKLDDVEEARGTQPIIQTPVQQVQVINQPVVQQVQIVNPVQPIQPIVVVPVQDVYTLTVTPVTFDNYQRYSPVAKKNNSDINITTCWEIDPIHGKRDATNVINYTSSTVLVPVKVFGYFQRINPSWKIACELEDGKVVSTQ